MTKNQLPQSAISLARPLLESYLRGSWLLRCSTPEHFQNIVEHRQPGPKISKIKRDLIKGDLIKCGDTDKSWIGQWTDSDIMCVLHDFAHVGALAAEQRSVGDAIAPSFPREMMTELMELGIGVRLRAGRDLLMLMGDSVGLLKWWISFHALRQDLCRVLARRFVAMALIGNWRRRPPRAIPANRIEEICCKHVSVKRQSTR